MYPELFKIGPLTVYSYGLMLGIGFIVASTVLGREIKRRGMDFSHGNNITLLAIVFGVIGSKLLYVVENWPTFLATPSILYSPGGLTWYGGFFLATVAVWIYARKKKVGFLEICDAAAPALMIGYGIARIGCHLAGDGDYGTPTDLPWSAVYSNGTYPPSLAFRGFPDIVAKYGTDGIVPNDIPVHPAPIYEFLLGMLGFGILLRMRRTPRPAGALFMIYLILAGAARFGVEFIRLNPRLLGGLSEAQLISVVMIAGGVIGYIMLYGTDVHNPDSP
ncbi:MAG TPA: prolipoprotein diacylglyceryl transferase [Bacteroidota bacterium]|nr:prolipoprotein diacylglyceryl transferase [Bacteroidota bacterium]